VLHDAPTSAGVRQDDDLRRHPWRPKTPHTNRVRATRNDARRNAIDYALQPQLAIARTLTTESDRKG